MERNHNEQQIVMSIEHYNTLLSMVNHNNHNPKRITKHVRKFNPFLQPHHQEKVRASEAKRSLMIREARAFKEQQVGKTVYVRVSMGKFTKDNNPMLLPVKVKRISRDRRYIDVTEFDYVGKDIPHRVSMVSVDTLQLDIPDNYIQGSGPYHKYLVERDSQFDAKLKSSTPVRPSEFDPLFKFTNPTKIR